MDKEERLQQAIAYREAKEYEAADRLLTTLRTEQANNAEVWYQSAWLMDTQGKERDAVPFYERALELGLATESEKGALLGLGSTYRCLGEYERAAEVLKRGLEKYSDAHEFAVFLAMTFYNRGQHSAGMELLLKVVAETSENAGVQRYRWAILFYADKLDEVFE